MSLENRIKKYFKILNEPLVFDFTYNPERIFYKNEALITRDRDLYATYLAEHYPDEMANELADFDSKVDNLVKMDKDQVQAYLDEKGFNGLKGDLNISDPDTIYYGLKENEEYLDRILEENMIDLLHPYARLKDAFFKKAKIWMIKD